MVTKNVQGCPREIFGTVISEGIVIKGLESFFCANLRENDIISILFTHVAVTAVHASGIIGVSSHLCVNATIVSDKYKVSIKHVLKNFLIYFFGILKFYF